MYKKAPGQKNNRKTNSEVPAKEELSKEVTAKDEQGDVLKLLSLHNGVEYIGMLLGLHGDCCCSFRNPPKELHLGGGTWVFFSLSDSCLIDVYINPCNS